MTIILPGANGWTKNQDSDKYGSFIGGMNLDLTTNKPHLRISPRMKITTDDIANLGVAVGFERFNLGSGHSGFVTIAGDRFFDNSSSDASATFAATAASLTSFSSDTADIMFFRKANKLVGSAQATLQWHDGSNFSDAGTLGSGTVHMMTQYGLRGYVTDSFKSVLSFNTSLSLTAASNPNTFTLDTYSSNNVGLFFSDILGASNTIWLFTINGAIGQPARVFTWDGATQDTPTNSQGYILDSNGVWAALLVNDTPYIINTEARLQVLSAQTFVDVENGRLPFDPNKFLKNAITSVNNRPVHPRGFKLFPGNKLRVFINNVYEDGTVDEFSPSGVYEFQLGNPALGWYHIKTPSLYTSTVTDYGQNRLARVGGMLYAKTLTGDGITLLGAQLYSDASATKEVIETDDIPDDTVQKYGYIVTPKIYASENKDNWNNILIRLKRLRNTGDMVSVKYRTDEADPTEATITWTSNSVITTTTDVSAYVAGDEIEVIQGKGSGKTAHIQTIENQSGTYVIQLDDTFTGATSGTAKARFQKWTKLASFDDQVLQTLAQMIPATSEWLQLKICLQVTGKAELDDITLLNEPNQ